MSIDVLGENNGENVQNSEYDRVIVSDRDEHVAKRLTLDDYRRILRELDQNRDLQNRRREKLSQVSQRRNLRKKRASDANQETSTRSSLCYLCNIRVALEDITTFAICRGCDRTVCRGRRCSDWDRGTGYWECVSCIRSRDSQIRAGEWILDQLNQRFKSPRSDTSRDDLSFKDAETQSNGSFLGSSHSITLEQKEKVREFLEDVIASMIGGSLDDVPVNQTHKHPSYLPLQDNECPGVAHVNLKRLIQKVIEEALNLPDLFNFSGYPPRPESHLPYFSSKRYEQLLATAVLNKVIDHYRNPKNHPENSSGIHSGSEFDSNHNALSEKAGLLSPTDSQKALDKHLEEASQASESSLKTRSTESDETYLSDYIQKHRVPLPDLSAASSEGTVDDTASSEILSTAGTEGTWEENWLFKKRKVKTDTNSTAIGMLVPSPTEEVKAFIGDKNVDEVSDLSEAGSDAEDDNQERPAAKLIESKTIIGGKNELISLEDTSSATDSLVSNPDSGINVTEARNEVLLIDGDFVEATEATNLPPQAINENVGGTLLNGTEIPIPTPRQMTTEKSEKDNHPEENYAESSSGEEQSTRQCATVTLKSTDLYRENFLAYMKPSIVPEGSVPNSPNFPGDWVLIQGCWEVRDPSESILINSGQYKSSSVALTPEEMIMSVKHQVESPGKMFQYKFLNDLKPDALPTIESHEESQEEITQSSLQVVTTSKKTDDNTLPTPEVELSSTDQFVCVMTYDEERQLVVCGSPKAQKRVLVEEHQEQENQENVEAPQSENWEPQVCEVVDEDPKETPPAVEEGLETSEKNDSVFHEGSVTKIDQSSDCQKPPVPLPRRQSSRISQSDETIQEKTEVLVKTSEEALQTQQTKSKEVTEAIPKAEIHSRTEDTSLQVKSVEQCSQIEKCESKLTQIHVKSEYQETQVKITETKTVEVQKECAEIHLRTVQVVENSQKSEKCINEKVVDAKEDQEAPGIVPQIQARTEASEEKEINPMAVEVHEEEKSDDKVEVVPEIHLRIISEDVKQEEIDTSSIAVKEVKTEQGSYEDNKPEIHVRSVETVKPEIHVRSLDVPPEENPVTEAGAKESEIKIEIHSRTVDNQAEEKPENKSEIKSFNEASGIAEEKHSEEKPVIHVRTPLGTFSFKSKQSKTEENLKEEPKNAPEIHSRTIDVSKVEDSEVKEPESKCENPTAISHESEEQEPEIHTRIVDVPQESEIESALKIVVKSSECPEKENVKEEPKKEEVQERKEDEQVKDPEFANDEFQEETENEEVQKESERKELQEEPEKEKLQGEPETDKLHEELQKETLKEEPKFEELKNEPEKEIISKFNDPEIETKPNQEIPKTSPEENTESIKISKTTGPEEEEFEVELRHPEKLKEGNLVDLSGSQEEKISPEIQKNPVELPVTEEKNSKDAKISEEELNAKIDEILQEESNVEKIHAEEVQEKHKETRELEDKKISEISQEPATEENIMSTSLEIKEQLMKIVKSDEETPRERPKTLSIENEKNPGEEEEVHLRYKSPIFQNILPRGTPTVVKLSEISNDDIGRLINVANIIKRSSMQSPEEPAKERVGDGDSTMHDFSETNTITNKQTTEKISTNAESLETVSKLREPEIQSDTPEPDSLEEEHLIPGSIAEREHLKWQHPDTDIPNNPYSPEALQQRLVGKGYNGGLSSATSSVSNVESPPKTPERSLQVVLGEGSPDHKRYGRDYYINDAKRSSGTRKKQQLGETTPPPRTSDEDKSGLFVATPIRVDEAEASGDSLTRTSFESSETSNASLQLTDSLTPSEDSDTTRIYEIETRETRLLRQSVITSSRKPLGSTRTPPSTPTDDQPQPTFAISLQAIEKETTELEEIHEEVQETRKIVQKETIESPTVKKSVSPDTVKFFSPKKPPVFTHSTTPTSPTKSTVLNGTSLEKKVEINNNSDVTNKMVIEEEVLPTLPSVKKLMSAFTNTSNESERIQKPKVRPKSLPLQADQEETTKVPESGKKSSPSNGKSPIVPGYSITARSLSKQFRDELKHSTSQEDETAPETRHVAKEEEKGKRHSSPERPPSPVLLPGRLKSNIAFFENLRKK
ncbi:microtubule-associated protein futsch isoform X2 [Lutzomyia longipalpis]|uniref:microtubule-associated protein futsch isoform X2 n=1 Tax=Lutzomyia longipalpis TaxID=7200 RepID=UPI002483769F|nr:microtubule-associated protein futsch isoform X2 [Lutzomyia longipalpis]XP_055690894.1 microtubule-associated protein futsch isoform X2 [Lutzomyia longipalpis]